MDAAVYSRPHVFDDGTVAFVMRERLTHHNVSQNAYAAYLFIEEGSALGGVRLFLRKLKEETDHDADRVDDAAAPERRGRQREGAEVPRHLRR